jgi:hypothetical protein
MKDKFSFGAASVMREVPPGESAEIKFNGKAEKVETDWGDKFSFQILIYSHPSYTGSFPEDGKPIESVWQSKSQAAENLYTALNSGIKELSKAYEKDIWELIRSPEGVYFLQQR